MRSFSQSAASDRAVRGSYISQSAASDRAVRGSYNDTFYTPTSGVKCIIIALQ